MREYQYIDIKGVNIAYKDQGKGTPMLLVHGFGAFSFAWSRMIDYLPAGFRFIALDLKGWGYSEMKCDDRLAPVDQAELLGGFIEKMNLQDCILIGHSMGGAISLISLFNKQVSQRVSKLVLIDSAGLFKRLPEFIEDLMLTPPGTFWRKYVDINFLVSLVLKQAYYDQERIDIDAITKYGDILRRENAINCLVAAARQIAMPGIKDFYRNVRKITIPILIIWGEDDKIIDVEDAKLFKRVIPHAEVHIIPACGHCPQEEKPWETAGIIAEFLRIPAVLPPPGSETPTTEPAGTGFYDNYKLRMRRLIDRWGFNAVVLIVFVKILQIFKKIGFKAEENSWRKATGIFLRNEHSKFILACFRLRYLGGQPTPTTLGEAKVLLIERLAGFLRNHPDCHWSLDWGFMRAKRKKVFFTDIIESEFDRDGVLLHLTPHLDKSRHVFSTLDDKFMNSAIARIIKLYNKLRGMRDNKRNRLIQRKLRRWIRRQLISLTARQELRLFCDRVLDATFIQFEIIPDEPGLFLRRRLATPNLKNRRHPGFGLLNVVCRFTSNLQEADLWLQHNHVSADGMPMQELLEDLKREWGVCGQLLYPATSDKAAKPEIFYFGNRIFRARVYINFERFIKTRKFFNQRFYHEMGGPATVAGMIIWGLAQHKFFRRRKFVFPIDAAPPLDHSRERSISLVIIRPSRYFDASDPLRGFLRYQREFNHRLFATQVGKSETYELLELYAMIHPAFYHIGKRFMAKAFGEMLGTAGITILKDAEMFVSPLTDLSINGFVALGNMTMPTEDGSTAGAVSICGTREQVKEYIKALYSLVEDYPKYCGIEEISE